MRYRTAFITGASTGLGLAFTEMLLREGVEVWGTARDTKRLTPRPRFHGVALELGDGEAAERIFLEAERAAGGFDLVINNAGFGAFGGFAETDFGLWHRQLEIMLVNTARLSHAALRGMLARKRGALVNISSLAAEFPMPYQATYNVVKSGLSALNESLMFETEGTGVIVVDFRPGDYRTDFEGSVTRSAELADAQQGRVWAAFQRLME
ncbi:MAG TPA: SDR family NAD(P)-dependent oxidoreductase, partial [Acidobacteriota bacterium]|nr:SDR family NAD(P)-dependent oxidoreductase [Acidobacteriota bacterium]